LRNVDSDFKSSEASLFKTTDGNNTGVDFMQSKYTPNLTIDRTSPP